MSNKFKRLASALPSFYKAETNTIIGGLLKSWGLSDDEVELQISNTKDQIFVETAEGKYLDFLGNNVGVPREPNLGLSDDDFRNLVPILSFFPKQVRGTIIALLDTFWGPGFTRPNVNSSNIEPFNLGPLSLLTGTANFIKGDALVKGVGTLFTTQLQPGDYIKVSTGSGYTFQKVSAIFSNTELELTKPWASAIAINASIALGVIRELSYIVNSTIEKTIHLKPYAFADITAVTVSELVNFINSESEHRNLITASVYLDPQTGNKLNIRSNTPGLRGAIQITGGDANTLLRLNFPLEKQIEVKASVFEVNPNEIVVKIPSSVPVLRRSLKGSVHPKKTKTEIYSNQEPFNFALLGPTSSLTLTVDGSPFTVNFTNVTDFADPANATALEVARVINDQLLFLEASEYAPEHYRSVTLRTTEGSSEYQITGGTANTLLSFVTTLQQDPDLIIAGYPSSYIFDPVGQLFTVTGVNTELAQTVSIGSISSTLDLSNASSFPNKPGKLLLNFGRSEQEGPISYNSRPNNSTLLIDASHVFQHEHLSGRKVNLISDSPTIPRVIGDDFPVFIVGTEEARAAAQKLIKQLLAAGVVIRFIISFPEVLFECVCRDCGPSQDPSYRGALTGGVPLVF